MINLASIVQARAILKIYAKEGLAYPANWMIWILTDASSAFLMPIVFTSSMAGSSLGGFSASQFFVYYGVMFFVSCFVTCHFMWELGFEIKDGIFTSHMIKPISYFQYTLLRNLSWRVVRLGFAAPLFAFYLVLFGSRIDWSGVHFPWQFWVSVLLGHLVSYTFVMAFAMLALFVQETAAIFELYYFPMLFLSGYMFPLPLMPDWVATLGRLMPFYYTTGLPTEIATGKLIGGNMNTGLLTQLAWIAISYSVFRIGWKYGTRHYTAVGM